MAVTQASTPRAYQIRKALPLARELLEKWRGAPPEAMRLVEALHIGIDLVEADRVGIEHRPAAPGGEAIAGEIDHVDIAGAERDTFFEDLRALIHQRIDRALDDLLIRDRLARNPEALRFRDDHLLDLGIRQRCAAALLVAVPAGIGLLAEAALLADLIGELRVAAIVRARRGLRLADAPADIVAGEIAHGEGTHRHAPILERLVDLPGQRALLEQELGLARILEDHAVADEAVAHAHQHRHLGDRLAEPHRRRDHVLAGLGAAYDLQEAHDIRRAEEVRADHILRPRGHGGDRVDVEGRGVGRQHRTGLRDLVEL